LLLWFAELSYQEMSSHHDEKDRASLPSVAIVGTDAMLAAVPATAVQLAHACLASGFDFAVPASWGDELIAAEVLVRLAGRERGPAVMCVCPFVSARLLASGTDLTPFLVPLVSPPVAAARYLRAAYGARGVRITYIGACPGASDAVIDARVTPMEFLSGLADHGISLVDQPRMFDSVMPPDRRRWCSLPGGVPSPEILWSEGGARSLTELDGDGFSSELAQHLLANERTLVDLAPAMGCVCSGSGLAHGEAAHSARALVATHEPPRAPGPVIDRSVPVSLEAPLAPATFDLFVPARARPSVADATMRDRSFGEHRPHGGPERNAAEWFDRPMSLQNVPVEPRESDVGLTAINYASTGVGRKKPASAPSVRHSSGGFPKTRGTEGRPLPRAYVARRRQSLAARGDVVEPVRSVEQPRSSLADAERKIEYSIEPTIGLVLPDEGLGGGPLAISIEPTPAPRAAPRTALETGLSEMQSASPAEVMTTPSHVATEVSSAIESEANNDREIVTEGVAITETIETKQTSATETIATDETSATETGTPAPAATAEHVEIEVTVESAVIAMDPHPDEEAPSVASETATSTPEADAVSAEPLLEDSAPVVADTDATDDVRDNVVATTEPLPPVPQPPLESEPAAAREPVPPPHADSRTTWYALAILAGLAVVLFILYTLRR
jgi:hypothetical protein